jgi:D-xylose 1-dehydrogenase (NADP+, D-xylono-1,5-lactone-forming)
MADILRWGFLSTANINNKLIRPIQASKNHKLVAVASRSQEKADTYAAEKRIPRAHGSYEALLADPEVDVIYNPLPNHLHAEWTIKACQAGKHVLCEKPFALNLAEVDAMKEAAQKAGVVLTEAFMYRHHPQTLKVKEMVNQGSIGRINLIRGMFCFYLSDQTNVRLVPEWGGGSIWDVGVYPISYMRTIMGAEPEEVFCWQVKGSTGVDISMSGELRFPNNVLGQFQCGFNASWHASVEIMGEDGSLVVPTPFQPYTDEEFSHVQNGIDQKIKVKGQDLYLGELEDMYQCIFHGKKPLVSLEDTRHNIQVVLACIESARTGKPVSLK